MRNRKKPAEFHFCTIFSPPEKKNSNGSSKNNKKKPFIYAWGIQNAWFCWSSISTVYYVKIVRISVRNGFSLTVKWNEPFNWFERIWIVDRCECVCGFLRAKTNWERVFVLSVLELLLSYFALCTQSKSQLHWTIPLTSFKCRTFPHW